ncbi:striatin-3 [Chironomus tepperi]|uniref:striatin-3 n=1 Tax=Chironomus tepperi TaxID=113505 RepID=UPI00391F971A
MRIINRQDIDTEMMDENSLNGAQNQIGVGQNRVNNIATGDKVVEDPSNGNAQNIQPQYTIPGILHFIEHEWQRFQAERSQWDTDRAELQSKIAVLLGERKGLQTTHSDLIRRIKMLEYALRQERIKFHRLKFGCDPPTIDLTQSPDEQALANEIATDADFPYSPVTNQMWERGRARLQNYLKEIGWTETIIDVRSKCTRNLLKLGNAEQEENINPNVNGTETNNKRASESQGRDQPAKKSQQAMADALLLDTEAAVMSSFAFLEPADVEMDEEDYMGDDMDLVTGSDSDIKQLKMKTKGVIVNDDDADAEAEEVLNDLNRLAEGEDANMNMVVNNQRINDGSMKRRVMTGMGPGVNDEEVDSSLGLGELAELTVTNESESTYDVNNSKESYRKTWNAKYTLRSHFDCVRALAFHPKESVLITGSEDHTLKLWNLQKTVPAKKSASLDVEPLYTFRAHNGPVLCLAMSTNGDQCYSGGVDGVINCWNLPNSNIDPYDSYDPDVLKCSLEGHTDAVWRLAVNHTKGNLVSASSDGTVKLWSPQSKIPLLNTYSNETEGIPTSVDFVRDETDKIVVSYKSAVSIIHDVETGKPLLKLTPNGMSGPTDPSKYINRIISHPTMPIIITAHEDRWIRFYDVNDGTLLHAMVAHLDAVTSLAIDVHGLYLLSGSHDCSIRLWNIANKKTCVQEITAHRKKFEESILDVAFHPTKPFIASAGADAIAKVFV